MEFLIKELSDLVGLTPRTIRYYEKEGVLPAAVRTSSGYRTFGVEDMAVLLRIKRLRALGFGLEQIRRILNAPNSVEAMDSLRELDDQLAQQAAQIARQRAAIDVIIETGAPLDVVPEFAAGLVDRMGKAYSDVDEDERDKMRLEILATLGTEAERQRTHAILRIEAETPDHPLIRRLADLDAQFAQIDASAPSTVVRTLVDAYIDALTQLYTQLGGDAPSAQGVERSAELYDDFRADIVRQVSDGITHRLGAAFGRGRAVPAVARDS